MFEIGSNKIYTFDEVLKEIQKYITKKEDIEFITRAFNFASLKHEGQVRKSGEPYINHCLAVTYLLATYQSAPATLAAGFLHDTMEDCNVTYQEIKMKFNDDVAEIVQAVTKIKKLPDVSLEESSASTHRKLILAMAHDIRAVIVKLCDRLHNMRTLQYVRKEKQILISKETLEVYAPLAHRLGMSELKNELENYCLYYLNPVEFNIVDKLIENKLKDNSLNIDFIISSISHILDDNNIPHRIFGRTKHLYSVYKKMYVKHISFEQIFDLKAIRIITKTKLQCYEILGIIHTIYKPVPGRFKDYIAMPKSNMYQSLHTTVIDENTNLFEIQIRTEEMDYVAERGIAAHWIYKENAGENISKAQELSEQQLSWLRDLITINEDNADSSDVEYMKQVQRDIFDTSIYVLTPKGKIIDLPSGATPVDFAYRVHSQVGNTCVGALVNKVIVPLDSELQNGDIVEIRTSKQSIGPSEDWLKFVKTSTAKQQIKKAIVKRQQTEHDIDKKIEECYHRGQRALVEYCKDKLINKDDLFAQLDFLTNLSMFGVANKYDLLVQVGKKAISPSQIVNKVYDQSHTIAEQIDEINKRNYTVKKVKYDGDVIIEGATKGIKIEMAPCCKPIPGDKIFGFISRGSGIKIHRIDCPNIQNEKRRLIEARWNENIDKDAFYSVDLEISSYDRNNLVVDLMGLLTSINIRIDSLSAKSHYDNNTATLSCTVYVHDVENLAYLYAKIKTIPGVISVNRKAH